MKQLKVMCKKVDDFTPNVTDNSNATLIEMCKTIDKASTDEEHKTQASYLAPNVAENSNATLLEMCKIINKSPTPEEYDEHKKQSYKSEDNSIIKAIENMESYAVLGCQSRHSQKTMVELVNNDNQKHPVTLANNNNVEAKEIKFYSDSEFNFYNNILSYNNEPFLNCYIEITGLVIGEKQNYYQCEIYVKGNVFTKNISVSEYSNAKWVNGIPGIAFLGSKNKSKDLLFIYLQKLVDKFDLSRQIKQYKKPGWQIVNEKYFYVTPEGVIGDENIKIVSENGQHFRHLVSSPDSFGKYLSFIECTKSNVATILILYFSMSLCNSLYRKADFTPKFTVFLHGPRGNFKTSLALALTQIEYSDSPIYTLKATKAGLESGFRSYRDSVMLIDDLAPTQVSSDRKALLSNLEVIVRAFGDGTGVVRNFDYLDKEKALEIDQYKAEGGAVLTGEFFEGCESSLARCLFLPLDKNNVDLSLLSQLQNHKHIVEDFALTFVSDITFLIHNTSFDVVSFIKNRGKEIRKLYSNKFSNERYGEYIAQLQVAADLLMYIARKFQLLSEDTIIYYTKRFSTAIQEVIASNNHTLVVQSSLTVLCNAILYNLDSENCKTVKLGEPIVNSDNVILYSNEFYYISQKACKLFANEYIKENGINLCKFTSTSVADTLKRASIIDFYQEGKVIRKSKKLPGYGSMRFMEISKAKLNEHIDFQAL